MGAYCGLKNWTRRHFVSSGQNWKWEPPSPEEMELIIKMMDWQDGDWIQSGSYEKNWYWNWTSHSWTRETNGTAYDPIEQRDQDPEHDGLLVACGIDKTRKFVDTAAMTMIRGMQKCPQVIHYMNDDGEMAMGMLLDKDRHLQRDESDTILYSGVDELEDRKWTCEDFLLAIPKFNSTFFFN